jgi:hypothetical protein
MSHRSQESRRRKLLFAVNDTSPRKSSNTVGYDEYDEEEEESNGDIFGLGEYPEWYMCCSKERKEYIYIYIYFEFIGIYCDF